MRTPATLAPSRPARAHRSPIRHSSPPGSSTDKRGNAGSHRRKPHAYSRVFYAGGVAKRDPMQMRRAGSASLEKANGGKPGLLGVPGPIDRQPQPLHVLRGFACRSGTRASPSACGISLRVRASPAPSGHDLRRAPCISPVFAAGAHRRAGPKAFDTARSLISVSHRRGALQGAVEGRARKSRVISRNDRRHLARRSGGGPRGRAVPGSCRVAASCRP
jgi:hypothetical protein